MDIKPNFLDIIMARDTDGITTLRNDYLKHFWLHLRRSSDLQNYRTQNHRMVGVGRDLCGSSSPALLPKQEPVRSVRRK